MRFQLIQYIEFDELNVAHPNARCRIKCGTVRLRLRWLHKMYVNSIGKRRVFQRWSLSCCILGALSFLASTSARTETSLRHASFKRFRSTELDLSGLQPALSASQQMMRNRNFVYVMFLNSAYISFAKSWVCNIQAIDAKVLQGTIFFTDSQHTSAALLESDNRLHVYTVPVDTPGELEYGHYDYYALTLHRLRIQEALLANRINVMLIEADAVWLKKTIDSQLVDLFYKYEIISADNHNYADDKVEISAGFSGYKASRKVRGVFKRYVQRYDNQLKIFENVTGFIGNVGEQVLLTQILVDENIRVHWLNTCEYASGAWYNMETYQQRCPLNTIKVLQNNYIVGNQAKVARARKWHHWFLNEKKCYVGD